MYQCRYLLEIFKRFGPGHGLHAAYSRRDAAFRDDLQNADISRPRNMRSAAQFFAESWNGYHAHALGILLAEKCHSAGFKRLITLHDIGLDFRVAQYLGIRE